MVILDVIVMVSIGLLAGNELMVSLFANPAVWQLEARAQAQALGLLARSLGRVMPFWYAACLVLLLAETWLRRTEPGLRMLVAAVAIWVLTIVYTVTLLVPINNRIATLEQDVPVSVWQPQHRRWDMLHRGRIVAVVVAMVCALLGVLAKH